MFHDRAQIHVEAGRGGDGALSFRREKHVPRGGPDGGDGGRGGDVVLCAEPRLRDLSSLKSLGRLRAGRGGSGRGKRRHGADGERLEVHVPVGTEVQDAAAELDDAARKKAAEYVRQLRRVAADLKSREFESSLSQDGLLERYRIAAIEQEIAAALLGPK